MIEPYYFEIPIYRCKKEIHTEEMKKLESKFTLEEYKESAPYSYENNLNHFHKEIWYPWKFNEVIGWICLFIMGNQIRGDYYSLTSKRIGKGIRKKKFKLLGKAFEKTLKPNLTSKEIYEVLLEELNNLNKEKLFNGRYFDLKTFKTIAEFVDWKTLSDKLNSYKNPRKQSSPNNEKK